MMRAPITDKHLLEMMWNRFPEIMRRGIEQPAQPEQEPLAERFEAMHGKGDIWITTIAAAAIARSTSPQTQPAQRKPLSVEEMFEAISALYSSDKAAWLAVNHSKDEYRAIEAKLKEKNA